jgi:hypothetical protein
MFQRIHFVIVAVVVYAALISLFFALRNDNLNEIYDDEKILDGSGGERIGCHDVGAGNYRSPKFFERWRKLRISNRL